MMQVAILLIFDWRDGPLEGVLTSKDGGACWHFKLIAERLEIESIDDRLFGLWAIPSSDCSILVDEFGDADPGSHVWPATGGVGSTAARRIVEGLLSAERVTPAAIIRTSDFNEVQGPWGIVGPNRD
jgi:hypothetical protein